MRVWIVSALLVAAVVGGVLYATRGDDPPRKVDPGKPAMPAALTENEVRAYMTVMPEFLQLTRQNAAKLVEIWEKQGKYPDDPELQMRAAASVVALLEKHGLTPQTWEILQRRVENVVNILRWERDAPVRTADLDQRIREKEALLESLSGETKAQVEQELARMKAQRDAPPPALRARDRDLVTRHWEHLDRIAPRVGPGPSDREGAQR